MNPSIVQHPSNESNIQPLPTTSVPLNSSTPSVAGRAQKRRAEGTPIARAHKKPRLEIKPPTPPIDIAEGHHVEDANGHHPMIRLVEEPQEDLSVPQDDHPLVIEAEQLVENGDQDPNEDLQPPADEDLMDAWQAVLTLRLFEEADQEEVENGGADPNEDLQPPAEEDLMEAWQAVVTLRLFEEADQEEVENGGADPNEDLQPPADEDLMDAWQAVLTLRLFEEADQEEDMSAARPNHRQFQPVTTVLEEVRLGTYFHQVDEPIRIRGGDQRRVVRRSYRLQDLHEATGRPNYRD
jgi:hypothetical protein